MSPKTLAAMVAACATAVGARADTLVEDNVESRVLLAFQADAAALQKQLPADVEVAPVPAGPLQGANLILVFYDRQLQQDGAGKTTSDATGRRAVVVAAAKPRTGKPGSAVLRVFTPNPDGVPGYYRRAVLADVERHEAYQGKALEPGTVRDEWEVRTKSGDAIHVRLEYARGVPRRAPGELLIFSSAEPDLFRIYRIDEVSDLVRSVPMNVDHAKTAVYRVSLAGMPELFGRETRLLAIVASPTHLRKVFLPDAATARPEGAPRLDPAAK